MPSGLCHARLIHLVTFMLSFVGLCEVGVAQEVSLALLRPSLMTAAPPLPAYGNYTDVATNQQISEHRFWDRENGVLFAANAALSAADFVLTRDNLRAGGRELNPVTGLFSGSTAGLAVNFAGETAGVVGLSYVFHKTGHHKLERWVSLVNMGSSATAVSFDLAHR